MHHHPLNQERAINLSILTMSGPGEFAKAEPDQATRPPLGAVFPSMPLSFSLATILLPEPNNFDFSQGAEGVIKLTTANL